VATTNALRVACSGNFVAVADGAAGLAIIDITDPPAARITHQLNLGASAQAVTAAGGIAYVGLASGFVVAVDLPSGSILQSVDAGGPVHDLGIEGDSLFVLRGDQLRAYQFADGILQFAGASAPLSYFAEGITGLRRLFVGGGIAYATSYPGYDTLSVTNSAAITRLGNATDGGPNSFKQIVLNGSGLGVAAVGVNPSAQSPPNQTHDIWLYDTRDPQVTAALQIVLPTPGITRAVSIYNGLAYAADGAAGLQVINYLPYDNRGSNPAITLSASFAVSGTNGVAEEGKLMRVTASVTDDVQVRNVEFYVDGAPVLTDGNFPFEHRFVTPRLTASKTNLTVRAKATDTGGNFAWSDEILFTLALDATPPRVLRTDPATNGFVSITNPPSAVFAYFNEPMDVGSLGFGNYRIIFAGADNRLGTADDRVVTNATVTYRDTVNAGVLELSAPLVLGVYQGVITTNVTDAAGNHLANEFRWTFAILAGGANDDDDGDGLTNAEELARYHTNPFAADSDGDGWSDADEVDNGTDPLSANSRPQQTLLAYPPVQVLLPSPDTAGTAGAPVFVAQPPVQIDLPSPDTTGVSGVGITLAQPPVGILLPSPDMDGSAGAPLFLALPPLQIDLPSPDTSGLSGVGITLAQPPVGILLPSPDMDGSAGPAVFLALPPLQIDLPSPDSTGTNSLGLFLAQPPVSIVITNQ
jgi:hypothetical protein